MLQNKKTKNTLLDEEYCEEFSEEELIELLNEEKEIAIKAIFKALEEDQYEYDYRVVETGEMFIYLLGGYPIRLSVKDDGYVEFSWFGSTIRTIEPISSLNDLTVLKSRIDYRKTQHVGMDPYMEYSLLTAIENPEEFANNVLLNALFFQADVNNVVARLKRSNSSFETVINWETFMVEY